DARPEPGMVVFFVYFDRALGSLELLTRQSFVDQCIRVGAAHLLYSLRKKVGLEIGRLHNGICYLVGAVLGFVPLNEGFVFRCIHRLEIVERGVMTGGVLRTHRRRLLLGGDRRANWKICRRQAELLELFVEGDDRVTYEVREDDFGAAAGNIIDDCCKFGVTEGSIFLTDIFTTMLF